MHILRDCENTKKLWCQTIKEKHLSKFFSLGLFALLDCYLYSNDVGNTHWDYMTFFGVVVATLWKDWNNFIFSQTSEMRDRLWKSIHHQVYSLVSKLNQPLASRGTNSSIPHKAWTKSSHRFIKVNTDVSHYNSNGSLTYKRVITTIREDFSMHL